MSWLLLQDKDNWLRNGQASLHSAPPAVIGYSTEAMWDGAQAIPYRGVAVAMKYIEIALPAGPAPLYLGIHDVRAYGAEVTGIIVDDYTTGYSVRKTITAEELAASGGSVGLHGVFRSTAQRIRIRIQALSSVEFSVGEICVGNPVVGNGSGALVPARSLERSWKWNTVENGPWRTKLAEPVRAYSLEFPPGREDAAESLFRNSEGGLRPVSFMPHSEGAAAVHGHLSDEYTSTLGLGGIYEGMSLQVQESMQPLRG